MKVLPRILTRIGLLVLFVAILVFIIALARGYRFNLKEQVLTSTGIIALSSAPDAAKIFVNNELKGVTNTNITLPPGNYSVKITKDGFTEWQKEVRLKGEVVMGFEAVIFPKNPSLSPLTTLGIMKAIRIGQTDKVIIFAKNNDVEKDGIYVLDGNQKRLSLISPLKRIILLSKLPAAIDMKTADVAFSSDFSQAIFTFTTDDGVTTYSYLLSLDNENADAFEVTASKSSIMEAWAVEKKKDLEKIVETFPKPIAKIAGTSFKIIAFSPDETKILYQGLQPATLPLIIKPPLIGGNQTPEHRTIQKDMLYIYDRKEDKNFLIPADMAKLIAKKTVEEENADAIAEVTNTSNIATSTPMIEIESYNAPEISNYVQWYPSSRHLVFNEGKNIAIMDYDGTNKQSVYSGPYDMTFFGLNSDWKLLVLSNLNPQNNEFGDVYEVGIR